MSWRCGSKAMVNQPKPKRPSLAEQIFTAKKDSLGLAAISANRAELYDEQKNYAPAIASWKAALAQFQALHDPAGITRALAGLGRALLEADQELANAEDLLRRA